MGICRQLFLTTEVGAGLALTEATRTRARAMTWKKMDFMMSTLIRAMDGREQVLVGTEPRLILY